MRIAMMLCAAVLLQAQAPKNATPAQVTVVAQPDSQRVRGEFWQMLERYPPSLRKVLQLDPVLMTNQTYLAPYPALVAFLNTHPEVIRNPSFYIGEPEEHPQPPNRAQQVIELWQNVLAGLAVFLAFGLAISLLVWLIRTLIDYRRWNRLTKVQTDVHTKLLDRFTSNEDLLAYMQSPAGAKFLESTPIRLDASPRSVGAPLARILWSIQGGVVLLAGGFGLMAISARLPQEVVSSPIHALGILAMALGAGFIISAIISYAISHRLGLLERPQ